MKRLVLSVLVLFATIINAGDAPEFDGAYIKTKDGKFIELTEKEVSWGTSGCHTGKPERVSVELDDFKGIHMNGQYDYTLLSFHTAGWHRNHFCTYKDIKIRAKSTTNSTYFEPKEKLQERSYGIWIEKKLWFFTISDKKAEAAREKAKLDKEKESKMKLWNSNEVFVDTKNNLIWQDSYPIKLEWGPAREYCKNIEFSKNKDWRLPSKDELELLSNNQDKGISHQDGYYWSDSTIKKGYDKPYMVNVSTGQTKDWYDNRKMFVRCVRNTIPTSK
ncbi:MAG: DUF1566 domain-containing protein [Sulfurimonadaceae bacterium]